VMEVDSVLSPTSFCNEFFVRSFFPDFDNTLKIFSLYPHSNRNMHIS
jgi:hypothetical protein